MRMRVVIAAAIVGVIGITAVAQERKEKASHEQKARKLLELSEMPKNARLMVDTMIEAFRSTPDLPPGFVERFKAEAKPEEFVELLVPVYVKHFSEDDLEAIIAFYETPAGKRMVKAQGDLARETQATGQKWGQDLGKKIAEELVEEQTENE